MLPPLEVIGDCIVLKVKVTPKASKNAVGDFYQESDGTWRLKVMVTTVPENGKANDAVIKLMAKYLHIAASSITVVAGNVDRYKTLHMHMDLNAFKSAWTSKTL